MVVDLRRGRASGDGRDTLVAIENVVGPDSDSQLNGSGGPNILLGYVGNDVLRGRRGDDCLAAWHGDDRLHGGPGFDFYTGDTLDPCRVDHSPVVYPGPGGPGDTVNLSMGRVTDDSGDTFVLFGVEGAFGSNGQDRMIGNQEANRFYGQIGSDVLEGHEGNDFLDGGPGADAIDGGPGTDDCNGEPGANCEG